MKILILGGGGRSGRGAAKDLVESDMVSKVVLGDINVEETKRYVERVGNDKLSAEYINLTDSEGLIKKMKEFDVIANAAWWWFALEVTKAAIEAKRNCVDLGGFYYIPLKQLELNESAKKAGITMLICMGSSPGICNVCVASAASKLDKIDEIHVRAMGGMAKPGSKISGILMTVRTGFVELIDNSVIFGNGELVEVPPRYGEEKIFFPEPFGLRSVYSSRHSEMATLPGFKGAKTVDFKSYFSPEGIKQAQIVEDMGLTSTTPVKIEDLEIEPRKVLMHCLSAAPNETAEPEGEFISGNEVVVVGKKNGENFQYTYDFIYEQDLRWGNMKTGIGMSIACQMLGRGDIKEKGVVPPEVCVDPEKFFDELMKRKGFKLTEELKRIRTY